MIDLNYKNHKLVDISVDEIFRLYGRKINLPEDFNLYKCEKCDMFISWYLSGKLWWTFYKHEWRIIELSCEEEVIKGIID